MELHTVEKAITYKESPGFILKEELDIPPIDKASRSSLYNDLLEEAGEDVVYYLESFNLIQNLNFILLSSIRHYLYGPEELKNVKTVINLKLINPTKQIRFCLKTMNRVLPKRGIFVGCFLECKAKEYKNLQYNTVFRHFFRFAYWFSNRAIPSVQVLSWLQYFVNPKKMQCLTLKKMQKKLEKNGFKLIDVREIGGLAYFISQKTD
jgi:hypothetical protein